jgi:hypothetical protein
VLASVILTSVLCIVVFAASNAANDAISVEIENAQFDQAKNVMLALDKLIRRIMYKPESSGYVKTSFFTITPYFVEAEESLALTANGQNLLPSDSIPLNTIRFKGGSHASVAADKDLIGNERLLLTDTASSLGRIQVYQSLGAWITLDYSRVRCIYSGTVQYFTESSYQQYNLIEITVVNMVFKDFEPQEKASIIAKNAGLELKQIEIPEGNNFTIIVQKGSKSESCTLLDLGGNTNYKTLINVAVVKIEVSILGED